MNPKPPRSTDPLHKSGADKSRWQEAGSESVAKTLFCDQCSSPSLEEELIDGICVFCARRHPRH